VGAGGDRKVTSGVTELSRAKVHRFVAISLFTQTFLDMLENNISNIHRTKLSKAYKIYNLITGLFHIGRERRIFTCFHAFGARNGDDKMLVYKLVFSSDTLWSSTIIKRVS